MATNEAQRFLNDVETNQNLRNKLKGSLDHIVNVAQQNGYSVSEGDLRQALQSKWGIKNAPNFQADPDTCTFV
ncbi:MAG TPA: Nif11-like leader peptide family natural product precursor [Thermoanaerobaculia bacterium]|nr:Nif11-like leader peptide family natural product precursor [Thermoanaerobaculia bacterium]